MVDGPSVTSTQKAIVDGRVYYAFGITPDLMKRPTTALGNLRGGVNV